MCFSTFRLGFLVDAELEQQHQPGPSHERHIEPHFILCRSHNTAEVVQKKRARYALFAKQEERRLAKLKFKLLSGREQHKMGAQRKHYETRMNQFKNVTVHMPSIDNKRQRLLHTSSNVMDAFSEKAELVGFSKEEFDKSFLQLHASEIPYITPSFSNEFIR